MHFFTAASKKKHGDGLHFERRSSAVRFLIFDDVGPSYNFRAVTLAMFLDKLLRMVIHAY